MSSCSCDDCTVAVIHAAIVWDVRGVVAFPLFFFFIPYFFVDRYTCYYTSSHSTDNLANCETNSSCHTICINVLLIKRYESNNLKIYLPRSCGTRLPALQTVTQNGVSSDYWERMIVRKSLMLTASTTIDPDVNVTLEDPMAMAYEDETLTTG